MKTAIELADAIDNSEETTGFERRCASMLRTLSQENEALLKANLDCFDNFNTLKADYDALKADAERYKWLKQRLLCADFSYGEPSEGRNALVFEIPTDMRVSTDLDSSIDAMKGKS